MLQYAKFRHKRLPQSLSSTRQLSFQSRLADMLLIHWFGKLYVRIKQRTASPEYGRRLEEVRVENLRTDWFGLAYFF